MTHYSIIFFLRQLYQHIFKNFLFFYKLEMLQHVVHLVFPIPAAAIVNISTGINLLKGQETEKDEIRLFKGTG